MFLHYTSNNTALTRILSSARSLIWGDRGMEGFPLQLSDTLEIFSRKVILKKEKFFYLGRMPLNSLHLAIKATILWLKTAQPWIGTLCFITLARMKSNLIILLDHISMKLVFANQRRLGRMKDAWSIQKGRHAIDNISCQDFPSAKQKKQQQHHEALEKKFSPDL